MVQCTIRYSPVTDQIQSVSVSSHKSVEHRGHSCPLLGSRCEHAPVQESGAVATQRAVAAPSAMLNDSGISRRNGSYRIRMARGVAEPG